MDATADDLIPTAVVWDEALLRYRFSAQHPMAPLRLDLTRRLCQALGLTGLDHVQVLHPPVATDEQLLRIHTQEYIDAVKAVACGDLAEDTAHGLGTEDVPVFADIHEASARIGGGSIVAADALWSGQVTRAVNFAGGMHHAHAGSASGFCVYNDCALGIARLLDQGAERVAYVDLDAHHGDGVESIFWDDPRVMTISVHESGMSLFPGTGYANEYGGKGAEGTAVNVAVPPRTNDSGYLRAVHAVVPQLLGAFKPQVLVTQHGCDAHAHDPLTNLRLSVDGQRQLALDAADWARDHAEGGRWLALGGGGYNSVEVVPRSWSHLVGVAVGRPVRVDAPIPQEWIDYVHNLSQQELAEDFAGFGREDEDRVPTVMGEGTDIWWRSWEVGYDPSDPIDQTIMATRKQVFPFHGLDPWFD